MYVERKRDILAGVAGCVLLYHCNQYVHYLPNILLLQYNATYSSVHFIYLDPFIHKYVNFNCYYGALKYCISPQN